MSALASASRSLVAALLLLCRELLPEWEAWPESATATLALVQGASRSQAYAMLDRVKAMLPAVVGTPGRPASQPAGRDARMGVLLAVRDYLMAHPGAVTGKDRRAYTDAFRQFVVDLVKPGQPGAGMSVEQLAWACASPWAPSRSGCTRLHRRRSRVRRPPSRPSWDAYVMSTSR